LFFMLFITEDKSYRIIEYKYIQFTKNIGLEIKILSTYFQHKNPCAP